MNTTKQRKEGERESEARTQKEHRLVGTLDSIDLWIVAENWKHPVAAHKESLHVAKSGDADQRPSLIQRKERRNENRLTLRPSTALQATERRKMQCQKLCENIQGAFLKTIRWREHVPMLKPANACDMAKPEMRS